MSEANLIKALKEGYKLSPLGKLQLASYFVQEALDEVVDSGLREEFINDLIRIQYNLFLHCNCGELEKK